MLTFTASQLELTRYCLKGPKPEKERRCFYLSLHCKFRLADNRYMTTCLYFNIFVMEVDLCIYINLASITFKGIALNFFRCADIIANPTILMR